LLQQAELVEEAPAFDDLPVGDAEDVDPAQHAGWGQQRSGADVHAKGVVQDLIDERVRPLRGQVKPFR